MAYPGRRGEESEDVIRKQPRIGAEEYFQSVRKVTESENTKQDKRVKNVLNDAQEKKRQIVSLTIKRNLFQQFFLSSVWKRSKAKVAISRNILAMGGVFF
ncbi:hypothetical protein TNCT_314861 [Trichonephila clavata]|uniref:Uncharacterized protein n=1 Tax=Trichonephila clavata TaxID=2740835 RepID=A0A8X6G1U4_TRICU|nr:hypothetical protein TNCT_314861 [Trichonephila clavata]